MWLRDAARKEELDDLDNPEYFPYRWGQAFWSYVCGRWGDHVVGSMLTTGATAGSPAVAIEKVLGVNGKELSEAWRAAIRETYRPILNATTPPSEIGRVVLRRSDGLGGDLNVGPAISPDGKWTAFLSERSLLSIDLFVADAATGRVLHKLTSIATDPHYSSLQFIHSAGAWDADSRRVAIATVTTGRPALAIFDAESGPKERELQIPELDEIFNPTWAPDGRAVAFAGMSRGLSDLYVFDLSTSALRQRTRDAFADLQPAWSPDGRRIAFATDRFSSRLNTLDIGPYRLALIDPDGGAVEPVAAFTSGKDLNPQGAPDSRALFFISDRDGIANLYLVTLDGEVSQITTVSTGNSGITGSSPALSVASRTGTAAFSVFDAGNYHVYTLDVGGLSSPRGAGPTLQPVEATGTGAPVAAMLPPLDRQASDVVALLADASYGLPAKQEYEVAQ